VSLEPLVSGDLTVEPRADEGGDAVELTFRGRSNERHPARVVVPYVTEILAAAHALGKPTRLHFETI